MPDRSEEETVEKSTDELLAETDDLLSDIEGGEREGATRTDAQATSSADDGTDFDLGSASDVTSGPDQADTGGGGWRRVFDPRSFLLAGALLLVGFVAGSFVPLGVVGQFAGVVGAAFLYGLGTSERRYVETGLAGASIAVASAFLENLRFAFLPGGNAFFAVMAVAGLVAGLLGFYFGSDLRNGITSGPDDLEDGRFR
ncbi:DUF456 domain-containing protein [Haloarchaeobius sp. HRN-SO-5]|uniref:DUF456 domain-containing protein n=1 Tax=Haloarchaeobius sp. HRN-SO-5 TaxID=3446118 RepID=UPI003EB7E2A8